MIKNYLMLAIKHLKKQKIFSFINVLGLTVGITCCFLIYLFILNETSFDSFHKNGTNIYRVYRTGEKNDEKVEIPYLSPPFGPALLNDYSTDVQQAVRVMKDNDLISNKTVSFNEKEIYLTDKNFFQFFNFPLIAGDPSTVLKEPNSIVLTKSTAKKYFGDEDPMGKILEFNKEQQLKVTGIAADVPVNSHLQFDMIIPLELLRPMQPGWFDQWPSNNMFVYLQLNPATDPAKLVSRFPGFMDKYLGEYYAASGNKMGLTLKPLKDIYFAEANFDSVKHGNKKMVYIFMCVAILVLVIACINFINLATARAADRSKEVGLRKTLGAVRHQLISQFMLESLLFAVFSCLLATGLVQLLLPAFIGLLGYEFPSYWSDYRIYIFLVGVIVVIGLLAGSYPALLLSSYSPVDALKGKLRAGKSSIFFRKSLVVFQFGISVLLIIGVVTIMSQMKYMRNTNLGFDKEQSLIVRFDNMDIRKYKNTFKEQIQHLPAVKNVSVMSGEPGGFHDRYSFEAEGKTDKYLFSTEFTDFDFIKTLGINIIAGRDFSTLHATDSAEAVIINRNAAAALGFAPAEALGKWIKNTSRDSLRRRIIGVVEDYHYASLKEPIGPLVITPHMDNRLALVKLKAGQLAPTIKSIQSAYTAAAPAYPFEYEFLDDQFNKMYRTESKQESLLSIFSFITIFIACLGLFGLASFTAAKRTKEIGVRKVLGSSVSNIVILLSKELLQPVLLGTLMVIPLGYFLMKKWLQDFAYRIDLDAWIFIAAMMIAVLIAFLTVSVQAIKAAIANPVKSLRTE